MTQNNPVNVNFLTFCNLVSNRDYRALLRQNNESLRLHSLEDGLVQAAENYQHMAHPLIRRSPAGEWQMVDPTAPVPETLAELAYVPAHTTAGHEALRQWFDAGVFNHFPDVLRMPAEMDCLYATVQSVLTLFPDLLATRAEYEACNSTTEALQQEWLDQGVDPSELWNRLSGDARLVALGVRDQHLNRQLLQQIWDACALLHQRLESCRLSGLVRTPIGVMMAAQMQMLAAITLTMGLEMDDATLPDSVDLDVAFRGTLNGLIVTPDVLASFQSARLPRLPNVESMIRLSADRIAHIQQQCVSREVPGS